MYTSRFDLFFENHIGFGIRWEINDSFPFHLSIFLPFVTITIGFGKHL